MNYIKLTEKEINSLKKLNISSEISNVESRIYENNNDIYKYFIIENIENIKTKLETIKKLIILENKINIKELVFPKKLILVNDSIVGYTMNKIKNTITLNEYLKDKNIKIVDKIKILNKLGILIDKTIELENKNIKFYFNDLNEYNFLINKETFEIYAIDLDNISLNQNIPLASYYMYDNKNLGNLQNKYKSNVYGITYPNHNTDLFCYIMIFLNTISEFNIAKLNVIEFNDYLNYLLYIGFPQKLINKIKKIYQNEDNENITYIIEEIPIEILEQAKYEIYKSNKKRIIK